MPFHTDNKSTIPYSFKSLPKNLMEESHNVDNKFLNNRLGEIEEAVHKKLMDKTSFIHQQVKYHKEAGILNHDNFFHCDLATGTPISNDNFRHSQFMINSYTEAGGCTPGDDLETYSTGGGWGNRVGDAIENMRSDATDGTVGECYDQVAVQSDQASGNVYMGSYDDSGSTEPNDLYAQTGSISLSADYNFHSLTEFDLTTVTTWIAYVKSEAGRFREINIGSAGSRRTKAYDFAPLPDPAGGDYSTDTEIVKMKIGHS